MSSCLRQAPTPSTSQDLFPHHPRWRAGRLKPTPGHCPSCKECFGDSPCRKRRAYDVLPLRPRVRPPFGIVQVDRWLLIPQACPVCRACSCQRDRPLGALTGPRSHSKHRNESELQDLNSRLQSWTCPRCAVTILIRGKRPVRQPLSMSQCHSYTEQPAREPVCGKGEGAEVTSSGQPGHPHVSLRTLLLSGWTPLEEQMGSVRPALQALMTAPSCWPLASSPPLSPSAGRAWHRKAPQIEKKDSDLIGLDSGRAPASQTSTGNSDVQPGVTLCRQAGKASLGEAGGGQAPRLPSRAVELI